MWYQNARFLGQGRRSEITIFASKNHYWIYFSLDSASVLTKKQIVDTMGFVFHLEEWTKIEKHAGVQLSYSPGRFRIVISRCTT
jgi:hypothetical protein